MTCPARSPESNLPCRLALGHTGVHEATVTGVTTAVWSEDRHPTEDPIDNRIGPNFGKPRSQRLDPDLAPLTPTELTQAEKLSRAVHRFARDKTSARLDRAVDAGVITANQAAILMEMWDEDSPYEPISNTPDTDQGPTP
jgi:hypothetical protein